MRFFGNPSGMRILEMAYGALFNGEFSFRNCWSGSLCHFMFFAIWGRMSTMKTQHLAITKWLTKTTAQSAANLNSPVKPEEENLRSVFSPFLERSLPIPILPILIPVETKKRRPTLYPLFAT